jgi:hypothetical protein
MARLKIMIALNLTFVFEGPLKLIYPDMFQPLRQIICGFPVTEITLYHTNTYITIKFSVTEKQH